MKMTVRRALTVGVAYVKLGFERVMQKRPDVIAKLADINERLGTLETSRQRISPTTRVIRMALKPNNCA